MSLSVRTLIVNLWPRDRSPGQESGLREVLKDDLQQRVEVVPGTTIPMSSPQASAEFLGEILSDLQPTHVILLGSPHALVDDDDAFNAICRHLEGRVVIYWEGDAWGRGKPLSSGMKRWMNRADHLVHTGGLPNPKQIASTQTMLHFAPNGYCHIRFAAAEREPPTTTTTTFDLAMLGNNVTRTRVPIPALTGLPGGLPRYRLARAAFRSLGANRFLLRGRDWPAGWSVGPLPFEDQVDALRSAAVSINWDHFANYPAYSSDRLPIALLAGRPHVTTAHPEMKWCPDQELGLFLESSIDEVLARALTLIQEPERAKELGNAAWEWARYRLSTREQMRFLLSRVLPEIEAPLAEPWCSLPSPEMGLRPRRWG